MKNNIWRSKINCLSTIISTYRSEFKETNLKIPYKDDDEKKELEDNLNRNKIDCSDYGGDIAIPLTEKNLNIQVVYNKEEFFERGTNLEFFQKDFIILDYDANSYLYYNYSSEECLDEDNNKIDNRIVSNAHYYLKLRQYTEEEPFADYYDSTGDHTIIFIANKKLIIGYPRLIKEFENVDIKAIYMNITENAKEKWFLKFFKEKLYDFLKEPEEEKFPEMIRKYKDIEKAAELDHMIFVKEFSFEKMKNDLKKAQEKYFSALRDVLSKLFSQIISIPLSISVAVFGVQKTTSIGGKLLIFIAYIIYVCFVQFLLYIYKNDVKEISSDFDDELKEIEDKSGLPKSKIKKEASRITRRIDNAEYLVLAMTVVIYILGLAFYIHFCFTSVMQKLFFVFFLEYLI